MRPISPNAITQGQHGLSKAVDYAATPDSNVYAPEDGVVISYGQQGAVGTVNDAGLALRMQGANGLHQFAHTEKSYVSAGQRVAKGQAIAKMGYTGYTIPKGPSGAHCHWWINASNGYVYPPSIINEPFGSQGGSVSTTDLGLARIRAYHIAGRNGYDGRPNALAGETDKDLLNHVGTESNADEWGWYNSIEGQNFRGSILPAVYRDRDTYKVNWQNTATDLANLQKKYDAYKVTSEKAIADLTAQNAELQAKLDAIDNGDAIIITRDSWNGLFDLIREYFNKKGAK